jgi:hypothetical protein
MKVVILQKVVLVSHWPMPLQIVLCLVHSNWECIKLEKSLILFYFANSLFLYSCLQHQMISATQSRRNNILEASCWPSLWFSLMHIVFIYLWKYLQNSISHVSAVLLSLHQAAICFVLQHWQITFHHELSMLGTHCGLQSFQWLT